MPPARLDEAEGLRTVPAPARPRSVRFRQALLLLWPTARTIRWPAVIAGAAAAQLVLWAGKGELSSPEGSSLMPLRIAAVLLCLGAGFIVDDDAGVTVEPVVASLAVRRGLRLLLAIPVLGLGWAVTIGVASRLGASGPKTGPPTYHSLPAAGLTLETAAFLSVALAAGAAAVRWVGHGRAGVTAGPVLLAFVMAMLSIGPYWPLFLGASAPGWGAAHVRWAGILAVAAILSAVFSLDPARRSRILRRRRWPRMHRVDRKPSRAPVRSKP
jgi:fluoroquinolone transport system permease protein